MLWQRARVLPLLFLPNHRLFTMKATNATMLTQGLLSLPGSNAKTKKLVKELLDQDRDKHHCFWGKVGFHNHLPHQ